MSIPESFRKHFDDWARKHSLGNVTKIIPLAGDGSTRSFYRIESSSGPYVLLIDSLWKYSEDYPSIQSHLLKAGLNVPAFMGGEKNPGFLVMEDLGDTLLQNELEKNPSEKMAWLKKATTLLAELHGKATPVPKNIPVSTRRFDTDKYFSELLFTEEHLCQKFLQLPPWSPSMKDQAQQFCKVISKIVPDVFCHRDYHTRNLLLHKGQLWLIDFQDARLGSPQYDLSSLVYDAYIPLKEEERLALVETYKKSIQPFPISTKIDWKEFDLGLYRVGFQRVVKAAGSFASFFTRFSKTTHLRYLIPALESSLVLGQKDSQMCGELIKQLGIAQWLEKVRAHGNS